MVSSEFHRSYLELDLDDAVGMEFRAVAIHHLHAFSRDE